MRRFFIRMKFDTFHLKHLLLPCCLYTVAALVAIFSQQSRDWLLPVLFLLMPYFDFLWHVPRNTFGKQFLIYWVALAVVISVLLFQNMEVIDLFIVMVLVAALPEEWFFRAYLQKRLGDTIAAVLVVSLMFSLLHFITHSFTSALLVFIPSVFFGWIYKQTSDIVLVVMLHALSNLVYYIYLETHIVEYIVI
jgi:membrane protease YdiL (CAAX protease family)